MYDTSDIYSSANQHRSTRGHKRSPSDGTQTTVLSAMQRFVSTVNSMNDTIMVPCRLLDMEMNSEKIRPVPELLQSGQDPYVIYGVLNSARNDLLYGLSSSHGDTTLKKAQQVSSDRWSSPSFETASHSSTGSSSSNSTANNKSQKDKEAARRISTLSIMSIGSNGSSCDSSSDADAAEETSDDRDSCLGSDDTHSTVSPSSTSNTTTTNKCKSSSRSTSSSNSSINSSSSSVAQASAELKTHMSGLFTCLNQLSDTALYITERYQEELASEP